MNASQRACPIIRVRRRFFIGLGVAIVAVAGTLPSVAATSGAAGDRVALVIGNAHYPTAPLKNTVNDARLVAAAATDVGFRVTLLEDASRDAMLEAIRTFVSVSGTASVRMIYFAGHGAQYRGRNYLIPVDAELQSEDDLPARAIDAVDLADRLSRYETGANLLVLDACRSVPFKESNPSTTGIRTRGLILNRDGLTSIVAPHGTLIAYSTAPGRVAADNPQGVNSPYSRNFAARVRTAGLPIETVFKRVRLAVMEETQNRQIPWESSSLVGDLCLVPDTGGQCGNPGGARP